MAHALALVSQSGASNATFDMCAIAAGQTVETDKFLTLLLFHFLCMAWPLVNY